MTKLFEYTQMAEDSELAHHVGSLEAFLTMLKEDDFRIVKLRRCVEPDPRRLISVKYGDWTIIEELT